MTRITDKKLVRFNHFIQRPAGRDNTKLYRNIVKDKNEYLICTKQPLVSKMKIKEIPWKCGHCRCNLLFNIMASAYNYVYVVTFFIWFL